MQGRSYQWPGAAARTGQPMPRTNARITVCSAMIGCGACSILLTSGPAVKTGRCSDDPNYAYWHSASFSNDGKGSVYDEWGGDSVHAAGERPNKWDAGAIFRLNDNS
jgi:hypothetical protein